MNLQLPAYGSCEHMFPGLGYVKIKMVYDKKRCGKKKTKQTNKKKQVVEIKEGEHQKQALKGKTIS